MPLANRHCRFTRMQRFAAVALTRCLRSHVRRRLRLTPPVQDRPRSSATSSGRIWCSWAAWSSSSTRPGGRPSRWRRFGRVRDAQVLEVRAGPPDPGRGFGSGSSIYRTYQEGVRSLVFAFDASQGRRARFAEWHRCPLGRQQLLLDPAVHPRTRSIPTGIRHKWLAVDLRRDPFALRP